MGGIQILEQDPDVEVEWVSWEGRPPGEPFSGYSEEVKREKYQEVHKPIAEKYGVPIRVAGPDYRTTNAHIATYYARDMGRFKEFRNRVYKARWVEDLDLESPDVLVSREWADAVEAGRWPGEVRPHTSNRRHVLREVTTVGE